MEIDDICVKVDLHYEIKEHTRGRRLKQVANRLNIAPVELANLIVYHGGRLEKNSNPILNDDHIKIVAQDYIKSVKGLFFKARLAQRKGKQYAISENYFLQFVDPEELEDEYNWFSSEQYNWELSEDLIERSFYKLINSPVRRTDNGSWALNRLMHRMISVVFSYCLDLKLLIKSILSPQLFFTYASEEDHNKVAIKTDGFFVA